MAMVVKNNMAAIRTLNTLNSNSSALQKSLAKVSSGMKINSAQDDASGYAISERMRVQIRALDQANQNTQNGSSMMKTAEGSVSSTIEILKTLKEKAINAATDTNTDEDRKTIQKEIDQFIDQIDDNALVTYNGKYLLEGSKVQSGQATYTAFTNQSLAKNTDGDTLLTELRNRKDELLEIQSTDRITASYVKDGKTYTTTFTAGDAKTLGGIFSKLESIQSDVQIFAKSDNASVQAATGVSETTEATGTTTTSGDYTADQLAAAKADLEAQLEAANKAVDEAVGVIGSIGNGAVKYNNAAAYGSDTSKWSGAAGDLAALLVEAANLGDLTADPSTVPSFSAKDAVLLFDNTGSKGVVDNGDASVSASGSAPVINLTGKSGATANAGADHWAGTSDTPDGANSGSIKTAVETVISRLKSTDVSAANTEAATALADKLQEALDKYNAALSALTDANDAASEIQQKLDLVNNAITEISAAEDLATAKEGMVDEIKNNLLILAHPNSDTVATGVDISANAPTSTVALLSNNSQIGLKLLSSSANANMDSGRFLTATYGNDDSALGEIAEELADKIYKNIDTYVTGSTDTGNVVATDAMVAILNNISFEPSTAANYTQTDPWASGFGKPDAAKYQAVGMGSATDPTNWGGTKADINGVAAAYDKYKQANYSRVQNQKDLDKVMANYAAEEATEEGPAIIASSNVGLGTSGQMISTADGENGITLTANGSGMAGQIAGITISVANSEGAVKKAVNTALNAFNTSIFAANESQEDTSLKLHVGGAANQSLSVGLKDMKSEALGLKGSDGSTVQVTTQSAANAAIAALDNALAKALDQQTTIGAIEARLEYTSSNLTTSSENVQAAESTIRDADMAKEMTTYTKNNVLLQAAQSMLAQANQNASAVLSLLQ